MTNFDTCPFCEIIVKARDKAICCDLCSKWIYIKCNNLHDLDHENLKLRNKLQSCNKCFQEILQFCSKKVNPNNINSELSSIDPNLKIFLCQLNNLSEQETNSNENLPNCKYRDVSYFSNIFLNFYLTAPWPTLGHYGGDSLTRLTLLTAFCLF